MYDMLKIFRTGRSHMALLTQPILADEPHTKGSTISGTLSSLLSAEHYPLAGGLRRKSQDPLASHGAPLATHTLAQQQQQQVPDSAAGTTAAAGHIQGPVRSGATPVAVAVTAASGGMVEVAAAGNSKHSSIHHHHHQGRHHHHKDHKDHHHHSSSHSKHSPFASAGRALLHNASAPSHMAQSGSQTPVDGGTGGASPDCEQGRGVSRGSYAENLESSADVNPAMSVTSKVSRSRSALTSIRRFFR